MKNDMMLFPITRCSIADRDHKRSLRQYAHTFHKGKNTNIICVASAIWDLPQRNLCGILAHEIGHLLAGQKASEDTADAAVEIELGIVIRYADGKYGDRLQFLDATDLAKFARLVRLLQPRRMRPSAIVLHRVQ